MRIHIVCGAGASSTFVAVRLRRSATARGLQVQVTAGSETDLVNVLPAVDVLLVGPHLAGAFTGIQEQALRVGARARLLPSTVFTARDGEAALDLALDAADDRV